MSKFNQKGFTGLEVVLIIALVAVVVGVGTYVVVKRNNESTVGATSSEAVSTSKQAESKLSEDEQILKAAKCNSDCAIAHKQTGLADVTAGENGSGGHIFLAKENGSWNIIFEGNGDVPQATVSKYNIPGEWLGPQL